ncbi:MAG TPA: hypothetical protein VKV27_12835 [Solirubrobacteraceae bacterium]|nr:hypothetical protein [Solirubrobacteraceae bacterium]
MYFRQLLDDETVCASYLFGCKTRPQPAVVELHEAERPKLCSTVIEAVSTTRHPAAPTQPRSRGDCVATLPRDIPPAPDHQAAIIAANRSGRPLVRSA